MIIRKKTSSEEIPPSSEDEYMQTTRSTHYLQKIMNPQYHLDPKQMGLLRWENLKWGIWLLTQVIMHKLFWTPLPTQSKSVDPNDINNNPGCDDWNNKDNSVNNVGQNNSRNNNRKER
jgi:hypothetical protein